MGAVGLASNTPSTQSLVIMGRGDTNYLREGDKITLVNMTWRFTGELATAEADPTLLRMVIIYDRRPGGAQAGWDTVYNALNINGIMNINEDTKGRFQVLHDQFWSMETGGTTIIMEKGFKDLKHKRVLYNANNNTIADIQQGNLFAAFCSYGNVSNVVINGYFRTRFVDDN